MGTFSKEFTICIRFLWKNSSGNKNTKANTELNFFKVLDKVCTIVEKHEQPRRRNEVITWTLNKYYKTGNNNETLLP